MAAYARDTIGAKFLNKSLERTIALFLGRISYSIYLSHGVILVISLMGLESINAEAIGQWSFFAVLLMLTTVGTIIVSWILYRFVEAPFIALGKRQGSKNVPVIAPV